MALTDRKPSGVLKILLRTPVWLYRARLGWLAGHRLVYIVHRGRRSGARREVVAEVVGYDPAKPEVVVIAAWGKNPDWYRNLAAAPALEIRIGAQRWLRPVHRFLDGADTLHLLLSYQRQHPRAWKRLGPLLGFPADAGDPRWPAIADSTHAIVFTPDDTASS
ncbi:MAG TPA: nitroreductase family deazaflavin-dependent oxidoreductase [Pseudonocardiaceae bacterium]|jgi:deazaflavin-dependent oxidoreductase (nitroreductase family)|nr:nitroreductase family deazaflavin-dependent oxidoreductase [Pseudonocardiaceae bacterium]